MKRISISIVLTLAALAPFVGTVQARTIVIGSPLTAFSRFFSFTGCPPGGTCTFAQKALPDATLVSPVNGVILRWNLLHANSTNFSLQVLSFVGPGPAGDGSEPEYKSVRSSAPVMPGGSPLETFTTALPIAAGQAIGLKLESNGMFAAVPTHDGRSLVFAPALVDGTPQAAKTGVLDDELGFNAEVQPAPTLTTIVPVHGPLAGGNPVTIQGTQFADVKEVMFGQAPARSFSVSSEGKITAIPPAVSAAATVPVSLTTVAGTATLPQAYTYEKVDRETIEEQRRLEEEQHRREEEARCLVPKLRGKKLAGARKLLRNAHCSLGQVKKRRGPAARVGKVVAQSRKPGSALPPGAKVNLTVGSRR